jgi:GDYXXLXY protein
VTRRWLAPALFGALCLAQLAVPLSMIARYEATLSHGTAFRVRTTPVDPVDAFRGRYVRLRLALDPVELDRSFAWNRAVWVTLEAGPDGFAKVGKVWTTRPAQGSYLEAHVTPLAWRDGAPVLGRYQVVLAPDRYYMEESKAPRAEAAVRSPGPGLRRDAWVTLRVRDGIGAVERLWVDGVPVEEYLRRGR